RGTIAAWPRGRSGGGRGRGRRARQHQDQKSRQHDRPLPTTAPTTAVVARACFWEGPAAHLKSPCRCWSSENAPRRGRVQNDDGRIGQVDKAVALSAMRFN